MKLDLPLAFFDELDCPLLGIIMDQTWYNKNRNDFYDWLTKYGCDMFGESVGGFFLVPNEQIKTLLMLRWM